MARATVFSLTDKQKYREHLQENEYVLDLKNGMRQVSRNDNKNAANAVNIAKKQQKTAEIMNDTLQHGLGDIADGNARVHEAVISQTEIMKYGLNVVNQTLGDGFYAVNNQVANLNNTLVHTTEEIKGGFASLQSSLDMKMSAIVTQFELQRKELANGLQQIANLLENSQKTKAKEAYLDGERAFSKFLQFPDETLFLSDAIEKFEESISIYKDNPYAYLYLGHAYLKNSDQYDEQKAIDSYKKCITYARGAENNKLAGLGAFFGGWAYYINEQPEEAVILTEKSVSFDGSNSAAYYNLAKYNAYLKNSESAIHHLDKAKEFDPDYILKTADDKDFEKIQVELAEYFEKIRDVEKEKWKEQLSKAKIKN